MFEGRIFFDTICDAYEKSEQNDKKYLDNGFHMIIVIFV